MFQVRGFGGEKPGDGPIWMDAVNCAGTHTHTHTHTLDGGGEEYVFFHGARVKIRV